MREIRTSGLMSGDRKRSDATWPKPPRLSSTLLKPDHDVWGRDDIAYLGSYRVSHLNL
jgi:hypothetical protein